MAFFFFWVQASFAKCPSIYIILFLHNESQVYVLFTFQSGVLYEWWFVWGEHDIAKHQMLVCFIIGHVMFDHLVYLLLLDLL